MWLINYICKNKMHLSLCDQLAEFVNLCPLGQDRKKWSINYKTGSMAFWNGHLTSVLKMRSCILFWSNIFICQPDKPTPQVIKKCLLCVWIWFFGGRRVFLKIYRNISCVKSCLSFNCWAYLDLHRQTTQTIEEANGGQNSFSHQKLGDVQLIRRAENFEVRK